MTDNAIFYAGVAREDITPPIGIRLCGYTVREGFSTGVHSPLTATALVIRGGETVAIVALDLTIGSVAFTDRVREACGRAMGVDGANVLVNYNHTHSAPNLPGFMPYDSVTQLSMQAEYAEHVIEVVAKACGRAVSKLVPARIATGWGACAANINRRQKTPEGEVLLGEDASAPCDSSVGVIRVDDLEGHPIAVAFRFSCHTVTLGPKTNVISPDFVAPARELIERELGCHSLFLQGCAGNQNPITGIGQDVSDFDDTRRVGRMLGAEVIKVSSTLRTHRERKTPRLIRSVAVYWLYEMQPIPHGPMGEVCVAQTELRLALASFPAADELARERQFWAGQLREADARGCAESERNVAVRFYYWSSLRAAAGANGAVVKVKFPLQVIRIGSFSVVAIPFEPMAETGLALRDQLGENTFVLGYSNGVVSYLPTPQISAEGGMEARLGYRNYLLPAEVPGSWEPQIQAQIALLWQNIQCKETRCDSSVA